MSRLFTMYSRMLLALSLCANTAAQAAATDKPAKPISGAVSIYGGSASTITPIVPTLHYETCLPQLEPFGLHCATQSKTGMPALVSAVAANSEAYQKGLQAGDMIVALQADKNVFSLTINRVGKMYALRLRTPEADNQTTLQAGVSRRSIPTVDIGLDHRPFPTLEIARDKHDGVEQGLTDNCWFEAGLAAMADSKGGPEILSQMITATPGGYTVKFRGVPEAVPVSEGLLASAGAADSAKWACVIETAETQVYPDNDPAGGATTGNPGVKVGLEMLTGKHVIFVRPDSLMPADISGLLSSLHKKGLPVTMASKGPGEHRQGIQPVMPNHAYSVVDFDTATNMVILRNPHGRERASADGIVENLGNGLIKVDMDTLHTFFRFIAYPTD